MARRSQVASQFLWWIVLLASLFLLLFFQTTRASANEPEIPVYSPPNMPSPSMNDALPSPLTNSSAAPSPVTPPVETPTKATILPPAVKITTRNKPKNADTSTEILSTKQTKKLKTSFTVAGGDYAVKSTALKNIRISGKPQLTRAVFDFDSATTPYCHVTYNQDKKSFLDIECRGVRSLQLPQAWEQWKKTGTILEAGEPSIVEEDLMVFRLKLAPQTKVEAFQLHQPSRLVVDMVKPAR